MSGYKTPVPVITLTTDFGHADWFAGTMKGVILGIQPRAQIVDITHDVATGDIRAAAFALAASCRFFPPRSVHVVVVDPGVGSQRNAIAVQTTNSIFVGPDNGVLSFALAHEKIKTVRRIINQRFLLHPVSNTFHGRDVFAPAAAHLSNGLPIQKLGPAAADFVRLDWPEPRISRNSIEGEIIYLDRFGNAITNIGAVLIGDPAETPWAVRLKQRRLCPVKSFYQAVPREKLVAVPGSSGFLEIAVNGGSAAKALTLKVGVAVTIHRQPVQ